MHGVELADNGMHGVGLYNAWGGASWYSDMHGVGLADNGMHHISGVGLVDSIMHGVGLAGSDMHVVGLAGIVTCMRWD